MYELDFAPQWDRFFVKFDKKLKERIWKKIIQIEQGLKSRHLMYGADYFVEEVGQYRICYKSFEDTSKRVIYFVGDHKEYKKWIRGK